MIEQRPRGRRGPAPQHNSPETEANFINFVRLGQRRSYRPISWTVREHIPEANRRIDSVSTVRTGCFEGGFTINPCAKVGRLTNPRRHSRVGLQSKSACYNVTSCGENCAAY